MDWIFGKKRVVPKKRAEGRDVYASVDTTGMSGEEKATFRKEQDRKVSQRFLTKPFGELTKPFHNKTRRRPSGKKSV